MNSFNKKLSPDFYLSDVTTAAKRLLGNFLVKNYEDRIIAGRIVEVEAYDGSMDMAAHSYKGRTKRNEVMFRKGGILYVYFTYGMHFCSNVVTGPDGDGCAVLIRGIEPVEGIDIMAMNRYGRKDINHKETINLTNGPAKITQAFGIDRSDNGTNLSGDYIFISPGEPVQVKKISASKRIGIKKSVDLPWRFFINDNPFVSKK